MMTLTSNVQLLPLCRHTLYLIVISGQSFYIMSDSEEGFLEQEAEESGDEEVENRSSDESGDEKELEGGMY